MSPNHVPQHAGHSVAATVRLKLALISSIVIHVIWEFTLFFSFSGIGVIWPRENTGSGYHSRIAVQCRIGNISTASVLAVFLFLDYRPLHQLPNTTARLANLYDISDSSLPLQE